ncbi:AraC family transcriptional regulator [Sporanaerobium hydrogeniformans]|uniref:AraC family transcriptional regulator n=1 Tax=Sporanaerobium hydrogeniformans TaxID=3072179 RepID=A0AC61DDI9_9FIRM|nr:helix-turn-helix domain-containing protein [Sporanaerobium hydrogeniformans]PHV71274.1 AraC family transcriptional regulator [Sporanaerobium hydrogeniformans]
MDKLLYFAETEGIALERMQRIGKFDMNVKHFHNEYEIFYLLEGKRQFFFDNRAYEIKPGSLILVNENAIHMTRANSDEDIGHDRIILYINKQKMKELDNLFPTINLVKFFREQYGVFHLNEEQQTQFMTFYESLKQEFDTKERHSHAMIAMQIIMYFIEFMRKNQAHKIADINSNTSAKYQTIYAVSDYISEHYTESLSLESLASYFFLSKYYLCRSFKEVTGYGINEYIHIHRIQKAKQLLEETKLSVSEISQMLGYESLTHFEKIFKTYMTLSPLKYRKTLNIVTYTNDLPITSGLQLNP